MVHDNEPGREQIASRIISAVTESEGVDEGELPPLYDAIDPGALEQLFRNGSGKVIFEYADHVVTVDHEQAVEVTPETAGREG